jgi:hypothetical protein
MRPCSARVEPDTAPENMEADEHGHQVSIAANIMRDSSALGMLFASTSKER